MRKEKVSSTGAKSGARNRVFCRWRECKIFQKEDTLANSWLIANAETPDFLSSDSDTWLVDLNFVSIKSLDVTIKYYHVSLI